MDITQQWDDLLFGVRRSIRYHRRRMRFFDLLDKWTNGISVVFGSGAVVSLLGDQKGWGAAAAIAVVIVQTAALVISTSRVARDHSDLARRFVTMESLMAKALPTAETLKEFEARRLEIEADEPPILRALDVLCHNELALATGHNHALYKVSWFQRRLAQVVSFNTDGLRLIESEQKPKETNS